MGATESQPVLTDEKLRDIDRAILGYLGDGRVTPAYCRVRYEREHGREYSRGYVQERLARLEDHEHVKNLYGVGLYELVDDPRDGV